MLRLAKPVFDEIISAQRFTVDVAGSAPGLLTEAGDLSPQEAKGLRRGFELGVAKDIGERMVDLRRQQLQVLRRVQTDVARDDGQRKARPRPVERISLARNRVRTISSCRRYNTSLRS
jgi:hypothetical protein